MSLITKEANFPSDYREAQVRQVMRAVYRSRSIAITGLAGMGKSNLARFIVSHPEARAQYLKERADEFAFVHLDCAGLSRGDEAEILDELAAQLQRAAPAAHPADPPGSQDRRHVLEDRVLGIEPNLNVAVVFDYFDQAATHLDRSFYNFLFHLRNARPRGNLSYIFVSRRSIGNMYELQELLDDECVVGPFVYKDALDSLRRDEVRLGVTFDMKQRDRLIACTGGHPGFLKNAAELVVDGRVDTTGTAEAMARQLLGSQKVQNLCGELWEEFTRAEREVLSKVARDIPLDNLVENEVAYLVQNGILCQREDGKTSPRVGMFCPLFELYVRDHTAPSRPVRITAIFPNQAHIETSVGLEKVTLTPKLFALLKALVDGQVRRNDELIADIYGPEAAGVTDAALSQLVKRLRTTLDPTVRKMTGDRTYTSVETVREVGYRLNG